MKTRLIHIALAAFLGLALIPLAGCDGDGVDAVEAERDAEGKVKVHVDGDEVDENFNQAEKQFEEAGRDLKAGAEQAGAAIERGAEQAGAAIEKGADRVEERLGPVLDDVAVTAKVKARLAGDPEVKASQIDVDTVNGRVTLNGVVESEEVRAEAEKLAIRTEGVKEVVNLLQVAGQAPPAGPAR
ncbi:MAG TPA: BON domain-containing protein [Thermoanaerobaculia bacterium]|nr:BON domain-containing protein [Thermoanaerobaculia bacterium]